MSRRVALSIETSDDEWTRVRVLTNGEADCLIVRLHACLHARMLWLHLLSSNYRSVWVASACHVTVPTLRYSGTIVPTPRLEHGHGADSFCNLSSSIAPFFTCSSKKITCPHRPFLISQSHTHTDDATPAAWLAKVEVHITELTTVHTYTPKCRARHL